MTDSAILTERLRGRTLRDLADTNAMSAEGIRVLVAREGRKQIDEIELALLVGTKDDSVVAFVVPDHAGPDFEVALSYVQWVTAELTKRGVKIAVHYRPTENGVVVALEDITRSGRAGT